MQQEPLIIVIGSSNTDMIVHTPRLPLPGETVLGGDFKMAAGGKGANQAVAAARMGARVQFIGCIGSGPFGDAAAQALNAEGILMDFTVRATTAAPGVALIAVDDAGQNSIVVAPGSNALLTPEMIDSSLPGWANATMVVLQLEIPLNSVTSALQIAHERHMPTLLNPAPAIPISEDILRLVDYLVVNETEAAILLGVDITDEPGTAAASLLELGPRCVTVTTGGAGSHTVTASGENYYVPAYKVSARDTTAAGDCFVGALAWAICCEMALPEAIQLASAAAAISVTRAGAQPSLPHRTEVDVFMSNNG